VRVGYLGALNLIIWGGGVIAAGVSLMQYVPAADANRIYFGGFTEAGID
jgi:hypothetical protein